MAIADLVQVTPEDDIFEALIKEARRRRRRRWILSLATVLLTAIVGCVFWTASGGGRAGKAVSRPATPGSPKAPASTKTSQPSGKPRSFGASVTNLDTTVIPTGSIDFASSTVGWLAKPVDPPASATNAYYAGGQESGEQLGNWSVFATEDGATGWKATLDLSPYVWGLDNVGTQHVWVVGLTELYGSSNGGLKWQRLGEPAGSDLVRVAFESPAVGIGLTVNGNVTTTSNGGASWVDGGHSWIPSLGSQDLNGAANVCVSGGDFILDDNRGDVFRSANPTDSLDWDHVFSLNVSSSYQALSSLDCSANGTVWEETYTEVQGPQAGIALGWVSRSSNGGVDWTSNGSPLGETFKQPPLSPSVFGSAFSDGMPLTSGAPEPTDSVIPYSMGRPAELTQSNDGIHFVADDLDGLFEGRIPTAPNDSGSVTSTKSVKLGSLFVSIYGISFDSPNDGWMNAVVQWNSGSNQVNVVYHTVDGGSTWDPVYLSPVSTN